VRVSVVQSAPSHPLANIDPTPVCVWAGPKHRRPLESEGQVEAKERHRMFYTRRHEAWLLQLVAREYGLRTPTPGAATPCVLL
jgi:hypothetical protein